MGATEISEDPALSRRMLSIFEKFERSNSTTGIIFPWLRVLTPAYLLRMALGTVLYLTFQRIIRVRKRTGRREDDALQYLLDQNTPLDVIIKVPPFQFPPQHNTPNLTTPTVPNLRHLGRPPNNSLKRDLPPPAPSLSSSMAGALPQGARRPARDTPRLARAVCQGHTRCPAPYGVGDGAACA